jgi:hypothetical protein
MRETGLLTAEMVPDAMAAPPRLSTAPMAKKCGLEGTQLMLSALSDLDA